MAKFTASVPLNIKWNGNEISGAAGATHRIPDALYDEFNAAYNGVIPGLSWVSQDETSAIPVLPIGQTDVTGLTAALAAKAPLASPTFTGTVTAPTLNGTVYVTAASAIQAAINALPAGGGVIHLPAGTYTLSAALTIPGNDITIEGDGPTATRIVWSGASAAIQNSVTSSIRRRFTMRDLAINNASSTASSGGVRLENFYDALIERCQFEAIGASGVGVEFYGTGSTYFNKVIGCWFNCSVSGSRGIKVTAGATNPNASTVETCVFSGATGSVLVDVGAADTFAFIGNIVANAGSASINVSLASSASYGRYIGNRFEDGAVTIGVGANDNRWIGNTYANSAPFTNSGARTLRIGEPDGIPHSVFGARAYSGSSIATNSASQTILDLTLEEWDQGGFHDNSTNPSRMTVPGTLAGKYRVSANIVWEPNSVASYRRLQVLKNGVAIREHIQVSTSGNDYFAQGIDTVLILASGDYVQIAAQQNSGGALSINGTAQAYYPELILELIGP